MNKKSSQVNSVKLLFFFTNLSKNTEHHLLKSESNFEVKLKKVKVQKSEVIYKLI